MADTGVPSTTATAETISGQVTAAPHNNNYGGFVTTFNTHTHDLTTDCVGDTELDAQRVRSLHATKKYTMISGAKAYTASGTTDTVSISFLTDAVQGAVSFVSAPSVSAHLAAAEAAVGAIIGVGITTTGLSVYIYRASTLSDDLYVYWTAYGEVA